MEEKLVSASYKELLKKEYERRRTRNPGYSLRAYARGLHIDAGTLSRIINGKQTPTYNLSLRLASGLKLTTSQENDFLKSTSVARESRLRQRSSGLGSVLKNYKVSDLDITLYEVISEWYHMGILEMPFLHGFDLTPKNVSKKLNISIAEAEIAIQRLISVGLFEVKNGKIIKKNTQLSTNQKNITTSALRRNQKQFLTKAMDSLDNVAIEKRSVTSMTMAIDPKRLAVAKKMIHEFNQTLCQFLEGGRRTRIYNLSVALNPLDTEEEP